MAAAPVRWRKLLRLSIFLFAILALFYLLSSIGWDKVGDSFAKVGWVGAGLLFLLGATENLLDAAALQSATLGRVDLWRVQSFNSAGALLNIVLPYDAGEVLKGTLLNAHLPTGDAIHGTIAWNYLAQFSRPLGALCAILCGLALGTDFESWQTGLVFGLVVLSLLPGLCWRFALRRGLALFLVRLAFRLKLLRKDPEGLMAQAKRLDLELREFYARHPKDFRKTLGFGLSARISAWICLYVAVQLAGFDYSFASCSVLYATLSVANYVTMLIPARLGVGEGTGYLVFAFYGLSGPAGLIVTVIQRIKSLVTNGLAALLIVGDLKSSRS